MTYKIDKLFHRAQLNNRQMSLETEKGIPGVRAPKRQNPYCPHASPEALVTSKTSRAPRQALEVEQPRAAEKVQNLL